LWSIDTTYLPFLNFGKMDDDILDSVLGLEDASYQEGFEEGKADGAVKGYAEGQVFGMERGYQKALEMGKLYGRTLVVNACLSDPASTPGTIAKQFSSSTTPGTSAAAFNNYSTSYGRPDLPEIHGNVRLKRHVETILKLTNPHTVSTENTDEAVEDIDDRLKKALAKAKVIDKLIAQPYKMTISGEHTGIKSQPATGSGNIEELNNSAVRR
jgi:hypothetical protein